MSDYDRLEAESQRPTRVADHSAAWARLEPVGSVNGIIRDRVEAFCATKRITVGALIALGTRVVVEGSSGGVALAFAYPANGIIPAIKFRPLGSDKKRYAATPSVFLEPLIVGNHAGLDWFVAEGETDAARLYELVGDVAAVMVLPAGAKTFKPAWAERIPRGATVHLCHDADDAGDEGAAKAERIIGGRTVRVRPPDGLDWCDWEGDREAFVELVRGARAGVAAFEFTPLPAFVEQPYPAAEPLLGEPGAIYIARGSLTMTYGSHGTGKSTVGVDALAHLGAGIQWLGIPVPRPVRACAIEVEGPAALFQEKLRQKAATWDGPPFAENVHVFARPWGRFTFADPDARRALADYCDEHDIDLILANPTLALGVAASGRPDETQAFVDSLKDVGLGSTRAVWLLHHEGKSGAISGDWGRHPDTVIHLQRDGNRPRTKLIWEKTRWATLPADGHPKAVMLEWIVETHGYKPVELDTVGASDNELQDRVDAFLAEHPWSSTTTVEQEVQGTASRIRKVLDSGRYDSVKGPRGAKLWNLAIDPVEGSDDGVTG